VQTLLIAFLHSLEIYHGRCPDISIVKDAVFPGVDAYSMGFAKNGYGLSTLRPHTDPLRQSEIVPQGTKYGALGLGDDQNPARWE
jgi:hypothetical protein